MRKTKQMKQKRIIWTIENSMREHVDQGDKTLGDYTIWTSWIMYLTGCTHKELADAMKVYCEENGPLYFDDLMD